MPLTVRLDSETERCLMEQLGGHPANFLATLPPGRAERAQRRERLDGLLKARRRLRP